jgi:histone H3/H4
MFPKGTIDNIFRQILSEQSNGVDRSTADAKKKLHSVLEDFAKKAAMRIKDIVEVQKRITAKTAAVELAFKMHENLAPLKSDKKALHLQKSIIKRLIKEQGVKRVADEAAILFGQYLLGFAQKLIIHACEVAGHANRKTVNESDIDFALKHI